MVGKGNDGPSKRPRTDNCVDLTEDNNIRNRVTELEEENGRKVKELEELKEENKRMKNVEGENKELREAMEELRGMVAQRWMGENMPRPECC